MFLRVQEAGPYDEGRIEIILNYSSFALLFIFSGECLPNSSRVEEERGREEKKKSKRGGRGDVDVIERGRDLGEEEDCQDRRNEIGKKGE